MLAAIKKMTISFYYRPFHDFQHQFRSVDTTHIVVSIQFANPDSRHTIRNAQPSISVDIHQFFIILRLHYSMHTRNRHISFLIIDNTLFNTGDGLLHINGSDWHTEYVDFFQVSYQRDYVADGNRLKFVPDVGSRYQIDGFGSDSIIGYDISDAANVMRLTDAVISGPDGEGNYSIDAQPATLGDRYLVVTTDTINTPDRLVEDSPSTLANSQNGADYIIITHSDIG